MCEWSDGVHSLEIEHIDTEKGSMSGVLFKGLEKKEVNGEVVYTGTVEPDITDLPDFYLGYTKLMARCLCACLRTQRFCTPWLC